MALLGHGSTPTRGPHFEPVRRSTRFLLHHIDDHGLIATSAESTRSMYAHGFATMYLAQVYGVEEDMHQQARLHEVLQDAVELITQAQSPQGGWLYTPNPTSGDEGSVTVTQIQALRACRNAGISVLPATVDRAVGYIRASANADGGIRYSIESGGSGRPPISAAAVAVLYNAGKYDDPLAEAALRFAQRTLSIQHDTSYWFYGHLYLSQALYQRGGDDWSKYFAALSAHLIETQDIDGSWSSNGYGKAYGTALALTMLQLPWAKVPIYQR